MLPLDSSNVSLDSLTGRNETIDFSDYLNSEHHHNLYTIIHISIVVVSDSEVAIDGHTAMQKRLKMF